MRWRGAREAFRVPFAQSVAVRPTRKNIFDGLTPEMLVFLDQLMETLGGNPRIQVSKQKRNIPKSNRPKPLRMKSEWMVGPATYDLWRSGRIPEVEDVDVVFAEWPKRSLLDRMNTWFRDSYGPSSRFIVDPMVPDGTAYLMPTNIGQSVRITGLDDR